MLRVYIETLAHIVYYPHKRLCGNVFELNCGGLFGGRTSSAYNFYKIIEVFILIQRWKLISNVLRWKIRQDFDGEINFESIVTIL